MEKIKIESFMIDDIEGLDDLLHKVEVSKYVSIKEKIVMINGLLKLIVRKEESGLFNYNSIDMQVLMSVGAVALYTNIEVGEDSYADYDVLCKYGVLDIVESKAGEDIVEFYDLLVKRVNDFIRENSVNHIISRSVADLIIFAERTMRHLDAMLDKGDPNKIAKYLSKGIEAVAIKMPDFSKFDIASKLKGEK